jgi:hypothetical protein
MASNTSSSPAANDRPSCVNSSDITRSNTLPSIRRVVVNAAAGVSGSTCTVASFRTIIQSMLHARKHSRGGAMAGPTVWGNVATTQKSRVQE